MTNKKDKTDKPEDKNTEKKKEEDEQFPGYPVYPASEDIMNTKNREREVDLDIDQVTGSFRHNSELPAGKQKGPKKSDEQEETWRQDKTGDDLDVPGAELDDDEEAIGKEDEENNLYSIGGDRHEDLEEDNGEFLDPEAEKI
ncbi:hypothetical protein CLV51_101628 [Chitinophaga niastensis]|uniref:Uncharacterized protein n=1 Tax=Chitinophaga niastensis TaxID=536980 RepID=A0A2P8HSU9_CHINA|nr:hypothetical protein [Chitinophaga niastensis]PSL49297.1 hypothetical protein CLV51_101628 [Chitinophaga niastensis]